MLRPGDRPGQHQDGLDYARPMEYGRPLYFHPVVCSIFLLLLFPRLISAVADWMHAILKHMVWL